MKTFVNLASFCIIFNLKLYWCDFTIQMSHRMLALEFAMGLLSVRSVVPGIQIGCRAIATHRRAVPHHNLKMLFGAQRKLHHAFEQLIRGHASEIEHNQLLGIEPHKVAKLQGLAA